jgi:hypothetical protein
MKQVIAVEVEPVDDRECDLGPLDFRNRHGAVERHDRGRGDRFQLVV